MSFFDADTFLENRHAQQIKHPSDSNTSQAATNTFTGCY